MPDDNNESSSSTSSCPNETTTNANAPMPKHIPFPDFPITSELVNEFIMFLFITGAALMQFINIYRAIWWLPESYTSHIVSFYQIDPYVIALILLMTARRFIYCIFIRALEFMQSNNSKERLYRNILKYCYGSILLMSIAFCMVQIYIQYTYTSLLFLLYPAVVYFFIFGFRIEPFLRSSCEVEGAYFNNMPMHCCSSSPSTIRDEVEVLRNDFNNRFKQVLFTSVVNAYYAGVVPCFFAVSVYYNMLWATQHIVFVWLSAFTMCTVFIFPSKYSDILHRASLHLGYWTRVEHGSGSGSGVGGGSSNGGNLVNINSISTNSSPWKKSIVWTNGRIVKHNGEYFRSLGAVTVAQPANSMQSRFYKLFHNPSLIYMVLTTLQASIVVAEIVFLYFAIEWHFLLSISFIALTNQFIFFKIVRDYLVTKRVYTAEMSIIEKQA